MSININAQKFSKKGLEDGLYAEIQTTKGNMVVKLFPEQTPLTVANFVGLAEGKIENSAKEKGVPFYDGTIFHRVIPNFMIQGGDPDGIGSGGPGYKFEDEFVDSLRHDRKGILSMANSGPNTNGSQFFITQVPTPHLDGRHTVFGEVIHGLDVIDTIAAVERGAQDKPIEDVLMEKVIIHRKGKSYKKYDGANIFEQHKAEKKKALEELVSRLQKMEQQAKTTESGLKYVVLEEGKGEMPKQGETINTHYTLYLADGKKIDSSKDRNMPFPVTIGQNRLIQGWLEAIEMFPKGSKVFLVIPPELGYGNKNMGGMIPPNSTLYFEMEFMD